MYRRTSSRLDSNSPAWKRAPAAAVVLGRSLNVSNRCRCFPAGRRIDSSFAEAPKATPNSATSPATRLEVSRQAKSWLASPGLSSSVRSSATCRTIARRSRRCKSAYRARRIPLRAAAAFTAFVRRSRNCIIGEENKKRAGGAVGHEHDVIQGHASRGLEIDGIEAAAESIGRAGGESSLHRKTYILRYRVGDHLLQRLRYSPNRGRLVLGLNGARRKPYGIEVDIIFVALGDGQISGIAQGH